MGHEAGYFIVGLDWTPILVALITLVGVCINAFVAVYVARLVRTPSKRSIGEQVESAHHIAITNRTLLTRMALALGVKADDPQLRAIIGDGGSVEEADGAK